MQTNPRIFRGRIILVALLVATACSFGAGCGSEEIPGSGILGEGPDGTNGGPLNGELFTASPAGGIQEANITFTVTSDAPFLTGAWEHSWNFGDGGTSAGPEVEHLYTQPGIYTVVLSSVPTVNSGAPDAPIVASLPVYVLPAYTIESAGDDTSPLTVYFAADTLIDDSAFSSGLTWDFGDNQMGTGKTTTHTYAAPGTYNVVLSFVVGTLSFNCSQVQTVVPKATGDKPLVADAGPNQTVTEGDIVALGGTGNNGDGPNVNYEWSQLSGPTVTLNDPGLRHPTFVAPEVTTTSVCEMRLEAFRNSQSRVSTVRITILDDDAVGGELTINGSNNLESTGAPGGPFNPSNIVYTLTNTGGLPIDWLAVGSDTWISLSTAGGTIAPGESSFLGVAVNLTANNFAAGNYSGSVRITNATDGQGGGTRDVNLSIVGPTGGTLAVTPNTDLASSGLVGGPFTPAAIVYTLTNPGTNSIDWAATGTESWTSLSATSGSLASGATTDVTVTINSGATGLSPGNHTDTVSFTNVTNGSGNTTRTVSLAINPPPGALTITPNIPTISSGNAGGPFSTSNNIYTLRNIGGTPIDWTATKTQNWVSVSSASGTLAAGATINLTVSINSSANGLSVGGYNDTVTIRNSTNGVGNSTRGVMLSVNAPPGALAITPSAGLSTSGTVGGPFTPGSQAYTLTNTGGVPINWSASRNQTWTTLSSTNGTLSAGANTTVTVSINSNANALTAGNYSDTVTFTNATNGSGNTSRAVSLMVNPAPGVLAVTPTSGFNSSGTAGGPFSPANKTYTLTNSGGTTLNWSVSKNQSWVTASPASGSLAAGANVVVTVSINSNADSLATGSYSDSVSITNLTNGNGNTTRSVALTVNAAPGALSVTPSSGLTSSGTVGGPFSPASKIYTLTNFGGTSINWTAAKTQSWVTLSSSGGTLAAGANTTVTVSINSNANSLAAGSFSDAVTFTNSTNGTGNTTRPVSLTVNSATPAGPMTAPFSPTSATINGILAAGEWTDANSYSMDAANQVAPGVVIEGTTTTSTDASAVIYVKQDSNFVYVAVDVTDDSVVNSAADVWDADSVELFLDANNSNTVDIGSERLQFDVNAGGGTAATSGVPSGSWNGAGATRSGGYVVEFRLSKSALGLTSSQTYGFDVHVHDVEPSAGTLQTGYWYFSAGPSPESDESQWGNLILSAVSQATLSVTPSTGLMATGLQGGPFSPNSKVFTLTNNGTLSMNWTAAKTQNWVNLSSASGTLAAGANTTVTVSLNANALAAGSFSDTVTFTNTTDGNGNTTRPIALTVTSPVGVLAVAGSGGTTCSGPFGGPFSTTSSPYTLTNTGNATMNWTATPTQNWVTPNPASGSLPAGASTTVNVSVNSNANALAAGSYSDTVTFTNTTNGTGNTTRPVALTVNSTSAQAMSTASRTSGVAPLAVFFDATLPQSGVVQPSENVAGTLNYASQTYVWDFGDPASGNWTRGRLDANTQQYASRNSATGYTSAHVFELPIGVSSANYSVTLTVTDEFGNQHVYHQTISVQGFSGTTYYVSSSGSDSNNGTSPSTPFSTVQKGLSVLSSGKRLLLNKGDTFSAGNVDLPSNSQLGAYGSGALPIINGNISPDSTTTVMDIRLDCGGASAFIDVWNITDLLVLRVTMVNTDHGAGDWYGNRLFLVDSTITNAALVSIFTDCNRLALLGNMFDRAINSHNLYLGVNRGVVSANNVWKPSTSGSGRHCMRIAASPVNPAFLTITDNDFDGSTTWCAIQFRSSSGTYEPNAHMDNLLFERNIVRSNSDTKLILCMGDYLNTTIRSNNFSNASPPGGFTTFEIEPHSDPGYSGHDGPRGVWFHDNTITNNGATWFSNTSPDSQSVFVYENAVNGQFIAGNPPP